MVSEDREIVSEEYIVAEEYQIVAEERFQKNGEFHREKHKGSSLCISGICGLPWMRRF